ncbi:MAG: NADH-dependent [FeFe] hydrogenase, group A6 [Clostridia bacterium]|nr:NADH-dependent [FeFe] hydrogenase, group A6 [Clostridia bacterium]
MANLLNIKINGKAYQVESGTTILDACKQNGIRIPTLCYLKDINAIGACRVCVCEVKGVRTLVAACVYPIEREGTEIVTNSEKVIKSRKTTLELMLSNHNNECNSCVRSTSCELQSLAHEYHCDEHRFGGIKNTFEEDVTPYLVRDNSKCILCRRCVAVCKSLQHVHVIGPNHRGFKTSIGCAYENSLNDVACVACGQCITVCPTGALREKDDIDKVISAINDPTKHVVVGTAPSVRVAIGEEFGYPIGTNVEGKMVTALKMLGFNKVFDVDFTADLTIMEEGTEFLGRLTNGGVLPMITSCSPGWINYIEQYYPEYLAHLSSCKSPQQMFGAVVKSYYAEKNGIDPKDIVVVSCMPCTAKKMELNKPYQENKDGIKDVDIVLTTRELARLIKRAGVLFNCLKDDTYDSLLGEGSTAGLIFGATGGVMEAALRTLKEITEGKELEKIDFEAVRGTDGVKRATVNVNGIDVKVAVAHGIENAHTIMEEIKNGKADYHFIEVMCCPGGCVCGGGQPIQPADVRNSIDLKAARAKAIYDTDKKAKLRKSHENVEVQELYKSYLGEPNGHKSHELLHTKYTNRKK